MAAKVYYDKDASFDALKGKKIAVIGFGSQGHAQAMNLRDSGLDVIIGVREGSNGWKKAEAAGFKPVTDAEAAKQADIIQILTPDETQAQVYKDEIEKYMTAGKTLMFSHGFNIHYCQIIPSADIDVIMVAPKGPGDLVRRQYTEGKGVPCIYAVQQDATGKAKETALAYAKGLGATRVGVIETTFQEETETDLFGEQAVLCGGVQALITAGWETLVEAGYQPEIAYFEALHEMKLIVDLIQEGGMTKMNDNISNTAEYGGYTRGPRVVTEESREAMREILAEIQDGDFAREFLLECRVNQPVLRSLRRQSNEHPIEEVGAQLRSMMPWLIK